MDIVFLLFMLLVGVLVAGWILSALARRHVFMPTSLSATRAAEVCESRFSRLAWRRVEGRGNMNFQARGVRFRGAEPPVLSLDFHSEDGHTVVEMWMSSWTTRFGMVDHVEKVFWKRWTLPKALREVDSRAVGPAPRPSAAASVRSSGGGAAPRGAGPRPGAGTGADAPKVAMSNPGRPEHDLHQIGWEFFSGCGLTLLSYSEMELAGHLDIVLEHMPILRDTVVAPVGIGTPAGRDDGVWLAYRGPRGSVIAYHAFPNSDGDFLMRNVTAPLAQLPDPLHWGIGTVGASVPAPVAEIVSSGHAVPLWELGPFAGQRPAGEIPADVPDPLQAAVLDAGWERIADNLFKRVVVVPGRFGQPVFFGSYNDRYLALMAPLGPEDNGRPAPHYRDGDFAPYELEVIGDMTMLLTKYPVMTPPSAAEVAASGDALARYAANRTVTPPLGAVDAYGQPSAEATFTPGVLATTGTATRGGVDDPTRWLPPPPVRSAPTVTEPPVHPLTPPSPPPGGTSASWQPRTDSRAVNGTSLARVLAIAGVAVAVVVVAAIALLPGDDDSGGPSVGGSESVDQPAAVADVAPCSTPPRLKAESASTGSDGLTVVADVLPQCSSGDLLSNDAFRVTVTDSSGRDVAAGTFDLASAPLAVGSDGVSARFTFPPGSYWRTADSANGLRLTAYGDGSNRPVSSTSADSTTFTAAAPGLPESGDVAAAAHSALVDLAAADRAAIDAGLVDVWQPQLSSKRVGLYADGIDWTEPDIMREHMELRQRFPGARLLWSGDWSTFGDPTWWVTVSGVAFSNGDQANDWCASRGFDRDHCFAKIVSHGMGPSGTTLMRR